MSTRAWVPAPLWRRLFAALYDWVLVFIALILAGTAVVPFVDTPEQLSGPLYQFYLLAVIVAYFVVQWRAFGRTFGMRPWRLHVRDADGERPGWGAALQRFAAAIVSSIALMIGFVAQLGHPQQQSWHDRWSGTRMRYYPKAHKS